MALTNISLLRYRNNYGRKLFMFLAPGALHLTLRIRTLRENDDLMVG